MTTSFESLTDNLKSFRFIRDTSEEKRDSRLLGKFKCLVGRVYKDYKDMHSPLGHLLKPFKVPVDWPVVAMLDFHLAEPQAIGFYAIDTVGRKYVIGEVWKNLNPRQLADEIIRAKKEKTWRIEKAYIDPLSKGDSKSLKNRFGCVEDTFDIIKRALTPHEILFDVAEKDKKSGIVNVQTELSGVNGLPALFVFDDCARHRFEFKRYTYEDGKPIDKDDHMMENLYRYTLTAPKYISLEDANPKNTFYDLGVA